MGMRELEENIAKLEEANEETRAVIREAHETIQTVKLTLSELRAEHDRWAAGIQHEVDAALERQVEAGLESFKETVHAASKSAHQHVLDEFDKLKNIMLYGNEKGKGPSLVTDWIRKLVAEELRQIARRKP